MLTRQKARLVVAHTLVGILIYSVWFCLTPRPVRDMGHLARVTRITFPATAELVKGKDNCFGGTHEGTVYAEVRLPVADLPAFLSQQKMSVYDENALDAVSRNWQASCAVTLQKEGYLPAREGVTQRASFANGSHTFLWVTPLDNDRTLVFVYYDEPF